MTKTYEELVKEGRRIIADGDIAVSKRNWDAGDKALEVEALPKDQQLDSTREGGSSPLQVYARDIGAGFSSLRAWRDTSVAWPRDRRRSRKSWDVHRTLNAQTDRFELIDQIKSRSEARQLVRDRDKPTDKPDTLPSSFGDRLVYATGQLEGSDTAFENLMRANDGRAFRQRHIELCARAADIMEARAELLRRIGNGEFERIEAGTFAEILRRPWAEGRLER